jgi:hypothetical protein
VTVVVVVVVAFGKLQEVENHQMACMGLADTGYLYQNNDKKYL